MRTYKIHLIRHGATGANEEGRYIGVTDVELSPQGRQHLLTLKQECEYPFVQKLYSSPLKRCLQTAEILYPETSVNIMPRLAEYNFGRFENRLMSELQEDEEFIAWMNGETQPEGVETSAEFIARCKDGFSAILSDMIKNKLSTVGVITHGGVIMNLLACFGLPQRQPYAWLAENGTGYTVVVNLQLWSQGQVFEVFEKVPYDPIDTDEIKEYNLIDIDDSEEE